MAPGVTQAVSAVSATGRLAFKMLSSMAGQESAATKQFVVLQHSSRFVFYHGSDTHIPITLLAIQRKGQSISSVIPPKQGLQIDLVRRGWRSGIFGWSVARWLGAATTKGIDVTPQIAYEPNEVPTEASGFTKDTGARTNFPETMRSAWEAHIAHFVEQQKQIGFATVPGRKVESLVPVATHAVRIPANAGDGYFRLAIQPGHRQPRAVSPDFRVYSVSLSSACPRGSSIVPPTIVPEMILRVGAGVAYTFFWSMFPVATLVDRLVPRTSGRKMLGWLARMTGVQRKATEVMKGVESAKDSALSTVPFSAAGIRTDHDLQAEASMGNGGLTYWRTPRADNA